MSDDGMNMNRELALGSSLRRCTRIDVMFGRFCIVLLEKAIMERGVIQKAEVRIEKHV